MTARQRAFVGHVMAGATWTAAAERAGYALGSAAAAGHRLSRHPAIVAELARRRSERAAARPLAQNASPLDVLRSIWGDETLDPQLRVRAATAAAPYLHARPGEGKKAAKAEAASQAATGRFAAAAPPARVMPLRRRDPADGEA